MPTPYLLVEHLTKSVGSKVLFSDISFAINEGDRIALIARNGVGKSTLLDILAGRTDYDSGAITFRSDLKVAYLSQLLSSALLPVTDPLKYAQLLTQLGVDEGDKPFEQLSGGQQKRIALARVLATSPDLLFLDEPTNHLDLDTVVFLEQYLRRARITLLLVTHDRYFLDNVCTDIFELDANSLYAYHGNYAYYLDKRAERIDALNAEIDKYKNLYRTELEWMRRMPQARAHKAQYRIDSFYDIERKAKRTVQSQDLSLKVQSSYIGSKIFEAKAVTKTFGDKTILQDFSYVFSRYEKLGIIGHNGTGKSTFLRLLLGEIAPDKGCFDIGSTVRFGYYQQRGLAFDEGKKVIDIVRDIAETIDLGNGNRLTASQFLQHFLFSPAQQYDYVAKLSGGERQRLHLCTILISNPNFLILDEPTNDLDIPTLQVLEAYLRDFKGCLIVVSHDRYFMDRVVDHLFVFHGEGKIQDFPGNYTQYREAEKAYLEAQKAAAPTASKSASSAATGATSSSVAASVVAAGGAQEAVAYTKSGKPMHNQQRKLSFKEKKELEQLEVLMPQLEQEKKDLEAQLSGELSDPTAIAAASARYDALTAQLDEAEMRWLELTDLA